MNRNEIVYVNIHGNPVPTILHNGKPHVGMKALCEQMGLQWESQYNRIKRDENLNSTIFMMNMVATDGKSREMVCLPLDMINGWLFGIDASRVKEDIRARVLAYQRECYVVLYNYWHGKGSYGTLTPADEIRYLNQRLSLLQALQRSRDAVMRQEIYDQYRHVSERLGFAVPALSAFQPPDDNDALDDLTRATLAQFFQAVATLEDAAVGYHLNHHREVGVLALNLNEVMRAAEASGVPLPHRSALLRALPQSRAPRFIGASVTVNSALATPDKPRYVRCYLFKFT
nr:MAG TPA: hypothetical protein [Caudoviricetes sp.]